MNKKKNRYSKRMKLPNLSSLLFHKRVLILLVLALLWNKTIDARDKNKSKDSWAVKIADSFIRNHPDSIIYKTEAKSRKWNYEQGLMLEAFYHMWKLSGDWKYFDYIKRNLDYYIQNDGSIKTYNISEFNIDNVTPGKAALRLYDITKLAKYKIAADTIRQQLRVHPRTREGGFWHKQIYPNQMWLDGLFMAEPFYVLYASMFNDKNVYDDIAKQYYLIAAHLKDKRTGLYYHGWDESKKQRWANPETGTSPNFWGRSIGWFMMSMVDVLDYFPKDHPARNGILKVFQELSASIIKFRDKKTKLWFQVVDKGDKEGNYIEASGSMMFIYSFAKGYNKGYLEKKYFKIADESFKSALRNIVTFDENNSINLNNVCSVAGLGGNPYRDGSFEYYINEPKRVNDFKGYGPFLLSAIELEQTNKKTESNRKINVTLDNFFNNEVKNGKKYHYIWEDSTFSGYSDLGKIFEEYGVKISSLETSPSKAVLSRQNVYIIVDPDSTTETEKPNYISNEHIKSITDWVNKGGILVLLANDKGNCEFNNLNKLSENFGLHFNGDSDNRVTGKNFDLGKFDSFDEHPIFIGINKIYIKEISSLTLSKSAKDILSRDGKVYIAGSKVGKGYVFAAGDPWLYNEYLDNRKLPEDFENYKAARNLVKWLLEKISNVN